MKILNKIQLLVLASLFCFMFSCQKENIFEDSQLDNDVEQETNVSVKNGILVFKTRADYDKYIKLYNGKGEERLLKESELGFRSIASMYYESNKADEELWKSYELLDYDENQFKEAFKNGELSLYSEQTLSLIDRGIMKYSEEDNIDYATCAPYLACVLNEDMMVCVNDSLFQFDDNCIKLITNGDFSLIDKMKSANEANEELGIIVAKEKRTKDYYYPTTDPWLVEKESQSGNSWRSLKLKAGMKLKHYDFISDVNGAYWYYYCYYVKVEVRKKNMWGNWNLSSQPIILYSVNWVRDFTWRGYDETQTNQIWQVKATTDGSAGYTEKLFEGWSAPADMYDVNFMGSGNVQLDPSTGKDVSVGFSHQPYFVPCRWYN